MRPASLAGPVRPALAGIRRVGLGEGRPSPKSWGVSGGELAHPPLENEPDRLRSAIPTCVRVSKTGGSQSLDLQRGVLETAGVDEVDVYHDLASGRDGPAGLDSRRRALRKGDVLVVWKLDRLGRETSTSWSMPCRDLSARGVGLRVGRRRRGADRDRDLRPAVSCRAVAGAGPAGCAARSGVTRTPASGGKRCTA